MRKTLKVLGYLLIKLGKLWTVFKSSAMYSWCDQYKLCTTSCKWNGKSCLFCYFSIVVVDDANVSVGMIIDERSSFVIIKFGDSFIDTLYLYYPAMFRGGCWIETVAASLSLTSMEGGRCKRFCSQVCCVESSIYLGWLDISCFDILMDDCNWYCYMLDTTCDVACFHDTNSLFQYILMNNKSYQHWVDLSKCAQYQYCYFIV